MNKDYMTNHSCAATAESCKPLTNTLLSLFAVCLFTAPLYLCLLYTSDAADDL